MNTNKIEVNGQTYIIGKMNTIAQFHVARRIGPVLAIMGITAAQLSGRVQVELEQFTSLLGPMTQVLAQMTDTDANYVLSECLAVVSREVQGRPAQLTAKTEDHGAPRFMFDDVDMPTMLRLVWGAIQENLGSFMPGLGDVTSSPGPSAT